MSEASKRTSNIMILQPTPNIRTKTTENFIKNADKIHEHKYDYSKTVYVKAIEKVIIVCKKHGEFLQSPNNHLQGNGCRMCVDRTQRRSNTNAFILKANNVHDDKYDYSKVEYINSNTKITIVCRIHGEFLQAPKNHLLRKGCSKCAGCYSYDTEEFILRANNVHNDKYDYSKVEYINSKTNITIICKVHGEFLQTPSGHLGGCGCILCVDRGGTQRYDLHKFTEKAKETHEDKYDYSKVVYVNSQTKILIICKIHGEFLQTPNSHVSGAGCIKCAGVNKCSTTEFKEKAIQKHGEKYDYSMVNYIDCKNKVIIVCKEHGQFSQTPDSHVSGRGCRECQAQILSDIHTYTKDKFIEIARSIHGDKYDYSKVDYVNSQTKVIIICREHGEFLQTGAGHIGGGGCRTCGIESSALKKRYTNEEFIEKATRIHGDKYDYSKVEYVKACYDVVIICKKHGPFLQKPSNHFDGSGCQKCYNNYSKSQIIWLNFMSQYYNINIQHAENEGEYMIPNKNYKADGYCIDTNTIYEYHGDYWHGNPKIYKEEDMNPTNGKTFGELYKNTLQKEKLIQELGYNLVVIWEYDWLKLNISIRTLQRKFRKYKK